MNYFLAVFQQKSFKKKQKPAQRKTQLIFKQIFWPKQKPYKLRDNA